MKNEKTYWSMKNGIKIDIDEMTIDHLRNTLKMIVRQNQNVPKTSPDLGRAENYPRKSIAFSNEEVKSLTNKNQYQMENEDNLWK